MDETTWPEVAHYAVTATLAMFSVCVIVSLLVWWRLCIGTKKWGNQVMDRSVEKCVKDMDRKKINERIAADEAIREGKQDVGVPTP